MSEHVLVDLTIIAAAGAVAQWLAWRIRLPSILLLLTFGLLAGPVMGLLDPDALLGDLLMPIVSVSVALILYEGGLTLRFRELRESGNVVRNLVTIGAIATWVISSAAAVVLLGLPRELAMLLGAVLVVTGPTVILPLLQHIRPGGKVGSILKWEGIVIDPIGALFAVLVFEAISIGEAGEATAAVTQSIVVTIVAGGGLGLLAAGVLTVMLARHLIPEFLQNAASLMLVVAVFTLSNKIQHESGLFAVTVMGIALANQTYANVRHIVEFKENLRVMLISALFILLAARLKPSDLMQIGLGGAAFVGTLILLARPASVFLSTTRSKLSRNEKLFLSWMAPRGIVAAAVASVFALRLEEGGYDEARLLVPITFLTIISTVAIYGLTSPWVAHRLRVADPNPQGILFVGGQSWVRAIASTLKSKGFRVLIVDSNRDHTAAARMEGIPTYTGSALADYTLDEIDLGGLGRVIAATQNDWVNVLAVQRFARLFGQANSFQVAPHEAQSGDAKQHRHLYGRCLFGSDLTAEVIEERIQAGDVIKSTSLSESFGYDDFTEYYGGTAVPLFIIRNDSRLLIGTAEKELRPGPGDTVVALVREREEDKEAVEADREERGA